ncbi:IS5 family transposase IS4811 [Usitatibacter rugosus]|uniref:IS5 family transposase IS4811 n=1 Tax=Usitatibacter rugosus TaxID=2732067 RepID=A0A6M4GZD1_9PROT|nr:AraC family transcriptional regulator [Usitatibacter rugosus]QJR12385.1 IS5 family transposase IS4811 [Usitatibacter rugosus]
MDALSDVLKSIHLEGAVYLNGDFTAPWCIRGECNVPSVRDRLRDAEHVFFFHLVTEGACRAKLDDSPETVEAHAGDVILIPGSDRHLLGSDVRLTPIDSERLAAESAAGGDHTRIRYDGGGTATRFVCGYLACSRSVCRPLLEALPRLLCIDVGDTPLSTMIRELLQAGVRESSLERAGAQSMLAKLSELMFVEAIRRYVEALPPGGKGWLSGLRDAQVGRALALLHHDPRRAWTVDDLAREVALSRSALAERFTAMVGEPPMQYLTRWRLALAAQALRSSRETIARVAEHSGYESEASFSRAFKREFGEPPATWRRARA